MGAVASSACEATQLREDCLEFGKVVQMMEGILLKAEGLENQAPVIDEVREALEEALKLLEAMRERGALQVFSYCTHPVLSGGAAARIADSMLDEVVVTDTIPLRDDALKCGKIRQLSTAPLLADTFTRIVKGESIMELFAE